MTGFYEKWQKDSEAFKPKEDTSQAVLWLKQMALMSPHFKHLRPEGGITELFLNACMELAYERGRQNIEEESYARGYEAAWQDVARKLDMQRDT